MAQQIKGNLEFFQKAILKLKQTGSGDLDFTFTQAVWLSDIIWGLRQVHAQKMLIIKHLPTRLETKTLTLGPENRLFYKTRVYRPHVKKYEQFTRVVIHYGDRAESALEKLEDLPLFANV